jgi:hypothetical protein
MLASAAVMLLATLANTPLEFLYDMRNEFINYSVIRSYMGMARRDIAYYSKNKTHYEQIKCIAHVYRGYYFAKSLMENNFNLISEDFLKVYAELKLIGETDFGLKKNYLNEIKIKITELREKLNYNFERNLLIIPKYMKVENQEILDNKLNILMKSDEYIKKKNLLNDFDMRLFYESYENDINY